MPDRRPPLALITPETSPEEAAAIVAAIEQFMRATTAQGTERASLEPEPWLRAAMLEGVSRADLPDAREPWINT